MKNLIYYIFLSPYVNAYVLMSIMGQFSLLFNFTYFLSLPNFY